MAIIPTLTNLAFAAAVFSDVNLSPDLLPGETFENLVYSFFENEFQEIAKRYSESDATDFSVVIGVVKSDTPVDKVRKAFKYVLDGYDWHRARKGELRSQVHGSPTDLWEGLWGESMKVDRLYFWRVLIPGAGEFIDHHHLGNAHGTEIKTQLNERFGGEIREIREHTLPLPFAERLPLEVGLLTNLQTLAINGRMLQELPHAIGNLKDLRVLEVINGRILHLPQTIGLLTQLKVLNLSNHHLEQLPETFGQLQSLEKLYLRRNRLEVLPPSFFQLTRLKELDLAENPLLHLSDSFGVLTRLQSLDLSHLIVDDPYQNFRFGLPSSFRNLTALEHLNLKHCFLVSFSEDALEKLAEGGVARYPHLLETTQPIAASSVATSSVPTLPEQALIPQQVEIVSQELGWAALAFILIF